MNNWHDLNKEHFWQAIGAAVANFGAQMYQNSQSRRNNAEQHNWSKEDASVDRYWQERMSNTAHQREVVDLKAAGLNPILSATGGPGASSPGGAMASSNVADTADSSGAVSSALEAQMLSQQAKLMKAQGESYTTAADYNRSLKNKTDKETAILGPKSYLYDKLEESLKSGAGKVKEMYKHMGETSKIEERSSKRDLKRQIGGRP